MNTIKAIKNVIQSRIERGATKENINQYLAHLQNDVWKTEGMRQQIEKLKTKGR